MYEIIAAMWLGVLVLGGGFMAWETLEEFRSSAIFDWGKTTKDGSMNGDVPGQARFSGLRDIQQATNSLQIITRCGGNATDIGVGENTYLFGLQSEIEEGYIKQELRREKQEGHAPTRQTEFFFGSSRLVLARKKKSKPSQHLWTIAEDLPPTKNRRVAVGGSRERSAPQIYPVPDVAKSN
ncbi:hypothetical protein B0H14DRAFT_2581449 [Mycena olivaceomarginata]|nr:hypothetical protein B0H14DRAFT_2581449 [Mycena olivaceomarginata]